MIHQGLRTAVGSLSTAETFCAVDEDGSNKVRLTPQSDSIYYADPVLTPDGRSIASVSDRDSMLEEGQERDVDVQVMSSDGSVVRNLADYTAALDSDPTWSPRGQRIAFVRDNAIHVMNADGMDIAPVISPDELLSMAKEPAWSPNGRDIAFNACFNYISVTNLDGSDVVELTPAAIPAGLRGLPTAVVSSSNASIRLTLACFSDIEVT